MQFKKNEIITEKEINNLDKFVLDFVAILERTDINYVLVSGYVSILFGRSRSSEDVDIIIEKINLTKFTILWERLLKDFECINSYNADTAYNEYLLNHNSIRFSRKNKFVPNMEVKFPNDEANPFDSFSLSNKVKVRMNKNILFVSPIELQIAFKLFLGSEKDIEDALHLYKIFKKDLNIGLIKEFGSKLKIKDLIDRYIR